MIAAVVWWTDIARVGLDQCTRARDRQETDVSGIERR
jgi:hypothetical protein